MKQIEMDIKNWFSNSFNKIKSIPDDVFNSIVESNIKCKVKKISVK